MTPKNYFELIGVFKEIIKRRLGYFKYIFLGVAIVFFGLYVYSARADVWRVISSANFTCLILACLAWVPVHLVSPAFTYMAIRGVGHDFHYVQALDIHASYIPAKFLPGGVWHSIARATILHNLGLGRKKITTVFFLENLMAPVVSISFGAGILLSISEGGLATPLLLLSFSGAIAALFAASYSLTRVEQIFECNVSPRLYVDLFLVTTVFWILSSISFLFFLDAFSSDLLGSSWLQVVGVYLYSWGVGFLAIFAPQGVGVFEVVAANLLNSNFPIQGLIVVLVLFRLVTALADLLFWLIWLFVRKVIRERSAMGRHLLPK
ncbi:lysylphosphatidylglycerol synthase domain-containing protein [Halothiobacillus diazotrophicus]|nr:lysylphosphatidylglycerol synthase domain-containing protein [Halothiobacillus diazotrophicus]